MKKSAKDKLYRYGELHNLLNQLVYPHGQIGLGTCNTLPFSTIVFCDDQMKIIIYRFKFIGTLKAIERNFIHNAIYRAVGTG